MTRLLPIGVLLFIVSTIGFSQVAPERSALRAMEKKHWDKAKTLLQKSLDKETPNALANYLLSHYFFLSDNPLFNLDSAYVYICQSGLDFSKSASKAKDKMKRFTVDSMRIVSLREQIDSAAFEHARLQNSEQALIKFIAVHSQAKQQRLAQELRDEAAYLDALTINTYESFDAFLKKYPRAIRADEARQKYNRLLYEAKTKDKQLRSFEIFLKEHPDTPFRREIEQNIFELYTISGDIERYISFIQSYPHSSEIKKATDILFHIFLEKEDGQLSNLFDSDSLSNVWKLQQGYIVPFLHNGRYGFMNNEGLEIIRANYEHIDDGYKCGNITEDIIVLPDRILARDKQIIYSGQVDEVDDLGSGFLRLSLADCNTVIHKSGFTVEACVDDAKIWDNRFVAIRNDNQWSIYALSGKKILADIGEDVMFSKNVFGFKRENVWHLITIDKMLQKADEQLLPEGKQYEEIKLLQEGFIWAKNHRVETVLDQLLNEIVPSAVQTLSQTFFGFLSKTADGSKIYDTRGKALFQADKIEINNPWIKITTQGASFLLDEVSGELSTTAYDSMRFVGPFVVSHKNDTTDIFVSRENTIRFTQPITVSFIAGEDSVSFLIVTTKEKIGPKSAEKNQSKNTVYNRTGKKLFSVNGDRLEYAGRGLFIIYLKEKKGLVNMLGEFVLPTEYDAIGSATNNVVSLLKGTKFGLYNLQKHALIKSQYDKNIVPYNNELAITFINGLYKFVGWDNKLDNKTAFEEITYWNDTAAFVKLNGRWALYDIETKKTVLSDIREFKIVRQSLDERIAITRQNDSFGVLSSKRGIIIPLNFTDIINIGSEEEPMYFTEKHVKEASVFVVIYYDQNGKLLKREVYDAAEDYENIYCHNR